MSRHTKPSAEPNHKAYSYAKSLVKPQVTKTQAPSSILHSPLISPAIYTPAQLKGKGFKHPIHKGSDL